jgi:hypothetical protein
MTMAGDDAYSGRAVVQIESARYPVTVVLAGRFEPVDGRYHWGGRILPLREVADAVRRGVRAATLYIGDRPFAIHLSEVDPWSGVRIRAVGTPPWAAAT